MKSTFSGIAGAFGKYKYPVLVLLLGVVLLLLPKSPTAAAPEPAETPVSMENQLEQILSQIAGAGQVKVMLSTKAGEQTIFQSDADTDSSGETQRQRTETVLQSQGSGVQAPVIRQVIPATYQGALVVCQGAENASVRLAIVEAVCDLTGLGADRITVVKMKES